MSRSFRHEQEWKVQPEPIIYSVEAIDFPDDIPYFDFSERLVTRNDGKDQRKSALSAGKQLPNYLNHQITNT